MSLVGLEPVFKLAISLNFLRFDDYKLAKTKTYLTE